MPCHAMHAWVVTLSLLFVGNARCDDAPRSDDAPQSDHDLLQGTWTIVGLESNGQPSAERSYLGNTISVTGDEMRLNEFGHEPVLLTFEIDPSQSPKAISLTVDNQPTQGIYELDGDELVLCLSIGGMRPTEFATAEGDGCELFRLRRGTPSDLVEWESFTSEEFQFSLEMPGTPERRDRTATTLGYDVEVTTYVTRSSERLSYLVSTSEMPRGALVGEDNINAALDGACLSMVSEFRAGFADATSVETELDSEDLIGRELTLNAEIDGQKVMARYHIFVVDGRSNQVFMMGVVGPEDACQTDNVVKFWDSFELIEEAAEE